MKGRDDLIKELSRFKRYRDNLIQGDTDDLEHNLRDFVVELRRNQLMRAVRSELPDFDAKRWWASETTDDGPQRAGGRRSESIVLPEDEGERLVALLELAESMADGELEIYSLGRLLGAFKMDKAKSAVLNRVLHPMADLLTDHLRHEAEIANPAVRELAAVPLDRIPGDQDSTIFLSHKSVDKPFVRPYADLLEVLGFKPWLDERDMRAGDTLHRKIADGFDKACAVVFFITPNFEDQRWLGREIDHAINRKVERGDRFSIITLVFDNAEVPRPLMDYLWVPVQNEVNAVRQIVRGLPVVVGPPRWRQ